MNRHHIFERPALSRRFHIRFPAPAIDLLASRGGFTTADFTGATGASRAPVTWGISK
jgi:hypothetical protein